MARRLIPRSQLGAKAPLLALSLVCLLVAFVLFGTGHPVGGATVFIAAFLLVAAAKRA
ncbi:MAG TPA: hypothetical protein VNQ77_18665 [Frankiaceae bacterium]|nr:hypothetical protein [Frankiaceae bacterium]